MSNFAIIVLTSIVSNASSLDSSFRKEVSILEIPFPQGSQKWEKYTNSPLEGFFTYFP